MLTAACATGVAAAFGAPFGGVVFAVEVVSTYFYVPNLPRMFLAAFSGTFVVKMLHSRAGSTYVALFKTHFASVNSRMTWRAFLLCASIGVITGLAAGLFVKLVKCLAYVRRRYFPVAERRKVLFRRFLVIFAVCVVAIAAINATLVVGLANWLPSSRTQRALITRLFQPDEATAGEIVSFISIMVAYFFLAATCVVLPIPAGLFIPALLLGALMGRVVAEIAAIAFDDVPTITGYEPGVFAVVGAAAFAAGTTRAISSSVIVVECVGQPHLLIPVSIGVLTAYFVANRVSKPVYDTLLEANAFPSLRKLSYVVGNGIVRSIMHPLGTDDVLTIDATVRDANRTLDERRRDVVFPLVNNARDMILVGEVQRRDLRRATSRARDLARIEGTDFEPASTPDYFLSTPESVRSVRSLVGGDSVSESRLPFAVESGVVSDHFPSLSSVQRDSRLGCAPIRVDPSPICVATTTNIHKVDVLFRTLRLNALYVHDYSNRLVGKVTRNSFIKSMKGDA